MGDNYTASAARRIVGVSQRRLDYWDEKGLVSPSIRKAQGKGTDRLYSFKDLVKLSVVKRLRNAGISLERIQSVIRILRRRRGGDPLADICLIPDGRTIDVRTEDPAALEDVLKKGQLVFTIIAAGEIAGEITLAARAYRARKAL